MSTVINEHDATASADATPARPAHDAGRAVRIAFGSLGLLVALALIGSAIAGIVWLETNRDAAGYFVTHTHHYQTSSYALSTESLNVGGVPGALEAGLVRLRITATGTDPASPLFVGIAATKDVGRYLAHVRHDELRDISFDPFKIDYRPLGTGAPQTPPSAQTFWQARAEGSGPQTISWPVERGRWTAVVMRADGGRPVSADAQLAARLSGAWWFALAFIVLGALSLLGGIALLRSGIGRHAPPAT